MEFSLHQTSCVCNTVNYFNVLSPWTLLNSLFLLQSWFIFPFHVLRFRFQISLLKKKSNDFICGSAGHLSCYSWGWVTDNLHRFLHQYWVLYLFAVSAERSTSLKIFPCLCSQLCWFLFQFALVICVSGAMGHLAITLSPCIYGPMIPRDWYIQAWNLS